jgi:C4-dicarboxylate-binding protein DctP
MMIERKVIVMAMAVLFVWGFIGMFTPLSSAAPIEIKLTTVQMKNQQMGIGIERFSKYATEILKDKVRIRTYPAAQLYTGQEEIQALMKGEIQMAYIIASSLDYLHPSMELTKLPYLAPDVETAYSYMDGSTGKKLFALMEPKNIHLMGVVSSGKVVLSNSKRPVRNVEDVKGLKMRSFGPMGAATLKALGAMAVVTPSEETYTALQQGVIDGATTPAGVFLARKYYDVQKYATDPGMLNATFAYFIANREWFNGLPKDVQSGLTAAANRLVKEQRKDIEEEDQEVFKQIAAKGCQVITLTPAEQTAWKKAIQPVFTEYGPKIGLDLIKGAQAEVEKASKWKK